jgi:hypothetical protein
MTWIFQFGLTIFVPVWEANQGCFRAASSCSSTVSPSPPPIFTPPSVASPRAAAPPLRIPSTRSLKPPPVPLLLMASILLPTSRSTAVGANVSFSSSMIFLHPSVSAECEIYSRTEKIYCACPCWLASSGSCWIPLSPGWPPVSLFAGAVPDISFFVFFFFCGCFDRMLGFFLICSGLLAGTKLREGLTRHMVAWKGILESGLRHRDVM